MAQIGNQNARKGKQYRDAVHKVLVRVDDPDFKPNPLERIVLAAYKKAVEDQDIQAINHFADRLDGKPVQEHEVDQKSDVSVRFKAEWSD